LEYAPTVKHPLSDKGGRESTALTPKLDENITDGTNKNTPEVI
jgi:hypothetical protein